MGNKGRSDRNIWGGYNHYDNKGHKTGHSERNIWGGYTEYDAKGRKTGETNPGFFGSYNHYDAKGHKTGRSDVNLTGYTHYDNKGHKTGSSNRTFSGYSNNDASGCYIATCVYGSYDCPEVWTLRRFRDYSLAESMAGRLFVKCYYAVSPTVVRLFGRNRVFRSVWRHILDVIVSRLSHAGYEDTPYVDRKW